MPRYVTDIHTSVAAIQDAIDLVMGTPCAEDARCVVSVTEKSDALNIRVRSCAHHPLCLVDELMKLGMPN